MGHMHYVMDIHNNYMKKPGKALGQPESGVHDEPERQLEKALVALEAPAQGAPAPPLLALLDT